MTWHPPTAHRARLVGYLSSLSEQELAAYCTGVLLAYGTTDVPEPITGRCRCGAPLPERTRGRPRTQCYTCRPSRARGRRQAA